MDLQEIKNEVFKRRPVLGEIEEKYGRSLLYNYIKNDWQSSKEKPDKVFLSVFKNITSEIYGNELAERALYQLARKPMVSTIEHHGIWGHPIFVNSALIYSLAFEPEEYAIALSTESVSLNNTSSWSGCFLASGQAGLKRFSLFSDKQKTLPVFSCPAFSRVKEELYNQVPHLQELLNNALEQPSFSAQASKITYKLWEKVFPSAPKLLYVPLESVVLKYLQVLEEGHPLAKLIFSQQGRELWKKYFREEHTFLFWGLDKKGRRIALKTLPDRENLLELASLKQIYPSSPLCFMVLLFSGINCAGGFTQTTWLTAVKDKFSLLLKDMDAENSVKKISGIPTKNFAESSLAYLPNRHLVTMPASLDLLKLGTDLYPDYVKKSKEITLKESLDLAMPGIYEVVVPKSG